MKVYCIICGAEIKAKRLKASCECFPCRCARMFAKKGNHASSTQMVKGMKKIDEQGVNFLAKLFK